MEHLNATALDLVDEAIDFADELGVAVHNLENDAVVVDFGVATDGGIEAGLLLAEIVTGGLATVRTHVGSVAGTPRTHVELASDHPELALRSSARPDWQPALMNALGSGPARLLAENGSAPAMDRDETFAFAVLALVAERLPEEPVAEDAASRCGVPTSGVFLPTVPLDSVAGAVWMAARTSEAAVSRLAHLGYDASKIVSVVGSAPVPPIAGDHRTALARAGNAIAHGGRVHLTVEEEFDRFAAVPYGATERGDESFGVVFEEGRGLDAVATAELAPAQATVDVRGGETHTLGSRDDDRLAAHLGL